MGRSLLDAVLLGNIDRLCRKYINYYRGFSYDFHTNGELDLLKRVSILRNEIVFDVGCNVGDWTLRALELLPKATIHAFEISKPTFSTLAGRVGSDRVVLNACGLADESGEVSYKDYGVNSSVNTLNTNVSFHDGVLSPSIQMAVVTTGDDYCGRCGIEKIDFLKIDVEGGEWRVLRGFRGMLSSRAIRMIQFEYGYASGDAHCLMRDYFKLFEDYGYIVARVSRGPIEFSEWQYKYNDFDSGPNFLAIKRDDLELKAILSR